MHFICSLSRTIQSPSLGPGLVRLSTPSRSFRGLIDHSPGTRWLTRWEKEVDLIVKLAYYGLTTGLGQ